MEQIGLLFISTFGHTKHVYLETEQGIFGENMTIGCKTSLVNRSSETFNGTHSRTEVFDIEDKPLGCFGGGVQWSACFPSTYF